MNFESKTVLVTGGSQGIGLGIAEAFAKAGARVWITGTRDDETSYDDDLSQYKYVQANLSTLEGQRALIEAAPEIDVLVNNAGVGPNDTNEQHHVDGELFRSTLETNLSSIMELSTGFHHDLKMRGGNIVNIGSLASHLAIRNRVGYTASKAGLLGLTKALADRWAPDGIRVNMVAPGFIETRMTAELKSSSKTEEKLLSNIPMARWGSPREIGTAALFLASPMASYITGISLPVDGGVMLR